MAELVFPLHRPRLIRVHGTDRHFPVRRVYCVGRNYADHVREMGGDEREPPFFFMKPGDAVVPTGSTVPFPGKTENLHHEAELVVAIGRRGAEVSVEDAQAMVWGYAAGNDLTRRDLQAEAKAMRRPWDMAKGFDNSAVCGDLHPARVTGVLEQARITCEVDGEVRQDGDIAQMIWSVPEIVSYLSGLVELKPGDLIYTGTPAGVGPIAPGQRCTVAIKGLTAASISFA